MVLVKKSFIKRLPNKKWRVLSHKGKNLGTYDTEEEANKRLRQVEFFKRKKSYSLLNELLKQAKNSNLTFSSTIRFLRKNSPNKINDFLKAFKTLFLLALEENVEDPESCTLLQMTVEFPEIKNIND